jgi:hypothetical protein
VPLLFVPPLPLSPVPPLVCPIFRLGAISASRAFIVGTLFLPALNWVVDAEADDSRGLKASPTSSPLSVSVSASSLASVCSPSSSSASLKASLKARVVVLTAAARAGFTATFKVVLFRTVSVAYIYASLSTTYSLLLVLYSTVTA